MNADPQFSKSTSPSERRALLRQLLARQTDTAQTFPVSFAQRRLWLLDQLEPGNPSYNLIQVLNFHGPLDIALLEHSFNVVAQRHESLRTTFLTDQGQPVQVVAPEINIAVPVVDISSQSEDRRQETLQHQALKEAEHSFDLTKGPLLRVLAYRLGATEHVIFLNMHHIIADGWSMNVLLRELAEIYSATFAHTPPSLPHLPVQYVDYALWQKNWLQGEVLEQQLSYWRKLLTNAPGLLDFPTDRPRPAFQTYRGKLESLSLSQALSVNLRRLSRQENVTLYITLLTIFQILLYRSTWQEDLVIGTPVANRNRTEIENLIGFFVNALALRTNLSGDPTFHDVLQQVREVVLDAYEYQDLPLDRLVEELNPERSLSYTPLFQVFFNMVNLPEEKGAWPGLTVDVSRPREVGAKFDFTLYVYDGGECIQLELVYNSDLFDQPHMLEVLRQFELLASQVVTEPRRKVSEFSLVTSLTRANLPDPSAPLSSHWEGSVPSLFAKWVQRFPEHIAIQDAYESVSYRELDLLSNQLANYLRDQGIVTGDIVAIYGYRSASLVWAILGVLKAGAAFLILDPAYPAARLISYLEVARIRGWLQIEAAGPLNSALEDCLTAWHSSCRLALPLCSEGPAMLTTPVDDPGILITPDTLACVTFTSGSTGKPKCVLQRHGPLTHFLPMQKRLFGLKRTDRYSLLSGLAHDPLQREIFTPLCLGATICIPPQENIGVPGWLAQWMQTEQATIAHFTPALMQLITQVVSEENAPQFQIPSLRFAFVVGDVLTTRDVARLHLLAPSVTCVNFYGSTETQRAVSYFVIPHSTGGGEKRVEKEIIPLGKGLQDVQLLVLNTTQGLAGIGELGEIYIRSPHLARGYLSDDSLTKERFLLNPFTQLDDDRLYKTGDLGRYMPDGNVQYVGRADQQVKLRGFRIELAEIEAILGLHPSVRECVVVIREDFSENRRLVAYVVPNQASSAPTGVLRNYLKDHLPDYMVPASFVTLPALPLTPNGKVDRQALPSGDISQSTSEESYVGPRSQLEERLAAIWRTILGVDRVSIYDNFFELGGHSLLATQLLFQVNEIFAVVFPLRAFFLAPTLAAFAQNIERAVQGGTNFTENFAPAALGNRNSAPLIASFEQSPDHAILPLGYPPIVGMQFHAFPLSILAVEDAYLPWFHSHYFQLYMDFELEGDKGTLDFYNEHFASRPCPWLDVQRIARDVINILQVDIANLLVNCLKLGYYACIFVDEFYIPQRAHYQTSHLVHDILVFGYDENQQTFDLLGFTDEGDYKASRATFFEMREAFLERGYHDESETYLLKANPHGEYLFDIRRIVERLEEYIYTSRPLPPTSTVITDPRDGVYGRQVYSYLNAYLQSFLESESSWKKLPLFHRVTQEKRIFRPPAQIPSLDIRFFHTLWEHKKCMLLRLNYLEAEGFLDRSAGFAEAYTKVEQTAQALRFTLVEYSLQEKSKKLIEDALLLLRSVELDEFEVLNNVLLALKKKIARE